MGSEMCIRDSKGPVCEGSRFVPGPGRYEIFSPFGAKKLDNIRVSTEG